MWAQWSWTTCHATSSGWNYTEEPGRLPTRKITSNAAVTMGRATWNDFLLGDNAGVIRAGTDLAGPTNVWS
jgi:hypothetical protein